MNIEFQRKVDRYAGTVFCFVLTFFHRIYSLLIRRSCATQPKRILVILLSEMGSLVLAHPMFIRIREKYPQADVYLLQFKKNRELSLLLDWVHQENILTIDDGSFWRFALDAITAVVKIRLAGIDTVIDCELFARISSIFSLLSGAAVRVGFHPHTQEGLYRGGFINRPVLYNPYRHMSKQFVALVDAIDSTSVPTSKQPPARKTPPVPRIQLDESKLSMLKQRLDARYGGKRIVYPDILVYPAGGILPIRAWPLDHYQALCQRLIEDGYTIGIIGMATDKGLARNLMRRLPENHCLDLTGFTRSIREILTLFHIARLLITNDGGPGHFAVLTPIASIVFFGPETPVLYGPMNDDATIFYTDFACSPCLTAYNHRNSPCDGDNQCLKAIDVDQVYRKAVELLSGTRRPSGVEHP
jgi:ADP-heptose:LPS heptosyltransferase